MHPKQTYTDEDAGDILDCVGVFMKRLAEVV
jgi:hypothetical protein